MALLPGKKNIGKNIETEGKAHPQMKRDQKVAIALNTARESGAKIPKPSARHPKHSRG